MIKKVILCFLLFFQINAIQAQATDWVLQTGGPFSDKGTSVDTDTLGNIYIAL